ncbi:MAG: hypothetical protein WBP17_08195 [Gemmatimonadota bacterium]
MACTRAASWGSVLVDVDHHLAGLGCGRYQINEKLGAEQSAIALMLEDPIDWDVLREVGNTFGAELLMAELRGEPLAKLEELSEDEDVQQAAEEEFDDVVAE